MRNAFGCRSWIWGVQTAVLLIPCWSQVGWLCLCLGELSGQIQLLSVTCQQPLGRAELPVPSESSTRCSGVNRCSFWGAGWRRRAWKSPWRARGEEGSRKMGQAEENLGEEVLRWAD